MFEHVFNKFHNTGLTYMISKFMVLRLGVSDLTLMIQAQMMHKP
jgi:hypothetical protein